MLLYLIGIRKPLKKKTIRKKTKSNKVSGIYFPLPQVPIDKDIFKSKECLLIFFQILLGTKVYKTNYYTRRATNYFTDLSISTHLKI